MLSQPTMPADATILIIRHGERPDSGTGLAPAGRQRALAYPGFFAAYPIARLYAAANSTESCRPQLTLLPLAATLDLSIDDATADVDYAQLAAQISRDPTLAGATSLICWHHGYVLELAKALGVNPSHLPKSATWPDKWPGHIYGWLLVLVFDHAGKIKTSATCCVNQKLMHDDHGHDPPSGTSS
jgi:hypothetical protein